jgi:hypothetical protein
MNEWSDVEMVAQLPGFVWYPADLKHYRPGRPGNISGGAQHYSAGTNSLDWLSRNPNSRVSAQFLIKHEPTLEDRGWQIVRIEDTAWTTGSPYNDFTVAIEYEHTGEGAIPDSAYQVIARTWHEIIQYVEAHDLGAVPIAEIRGHRDWVGDGRICPDGVMVERIRADVTALQDAGTGGYPEITFPTGFALSGAFARFWRELGDDAWRTIGYPTGEEYTGDIYGAEWLIQFTDVGVLGHNPETDETRMLKRDQRQQLDTVERDAREVLERIRELLREAA